MPFLRRGKPDRLGPLQTAAAWLHLWTPPRGAEVPAPPRLKLLAGGLCVVAAVGLAFAMVAPALERSKARAAARERIEAAEQAAIRRRFTTREQAARSGRGSKPVGRGAPSRAARQTLVSDLESAITRDARGRVRARTFKGPIRGTRCAPYPRGAADPAAGELAAGRYECLAVLSDVAANGGGGALATGYPFRAVVHFERRRFTWCKVNPVAGERGVADPRTLVPVPAACLRP